MRLGREATGLVHPAPARIRIDRVELLPRIRPIALRRVVAERGNASSDVAVAGEPIRNLCVVENSAGDQLRDDEADEQTDQCPTIGMRGGQDGLEVLTLMYRRTTRASELDRIAAVVRSGSR